MDFCNIRVIKNVFFQFLRHKSGVAMTQKVKNLF